MNKLNHIKSHIITDTELTKQLAIWRFKSKKIVFTNGCFDVLHRGHIEYLAQAASLGDILVVGLNTDQSVKRLKGANRPVNPEDARAVTLAALSCVSIVVLFDEDTPLELIKKVKPNILVKGSDYKTEKIIGYNEVTQSGGTVITIDLIDGFSSSAIIKKLESQ